LLRHLLPGSQLAGPLLAGDNRLHLQRIIPWQSVVVSKCCWRRRRASPWLVLPVLCTSGAVTARIGSIKHSCFVSLPSSIMYGTTDCSGAVLSTITVYQAGCVHVNTGGQAYTYHFKSIKYVYDLPAMASRGRYLHDGCRCDSSSKCCGLPSFWCQ
jgi:hypothetical protein